MHRKNGGAYQKVDASAFTRHTLDNSEQHGVVFMDLLGTIRGWSHGACFITGFSEEDALGKPGSIIYTPEDRERKLDEHELRTALVVGVAEDERWHLRKDGSRFWSSGVCVPLKNRRGKISGFLKIFRDRTPLRSRMKFLENAVQEQTVQQLQRDVFLGTIAHELRNPLSPIKAATRLLEQEAPPGSRMEQATKMIDRQVAAMERLVEDLVDLTRLNTGRFAIVYEATQLQNIVANAIDTCRPQALTRDIELHTSVPAVTIELELDSGRVHQVLVNLLNNAIKYTSAGGKVWLTATVDQTHVLFFVKDTGIGIGADLLPRIFDMFTQAPNADVHRGSGLGIGLALVKQVVELHQGTVEVRSEGEGKGSEFIVRIPLRKPQGSEPEPGNR